MKIPLVTTIFLLSWCGRATASEEVVKASPTVQGGMTVAVLRLATAGSQPTAITFGKTNQYKMGVDSSGHFSLSSWRSPLLSVDKKDTMTIHSSVLKTMSLDLSGEFKIRGVPQFRMVAREDYTTGEARGWDNKASRRIVSQCAGIFMLGGFGIFAKGEVTKKFGPLPPHSALRLKATFHFIDSWTGATGFARMNVGPNNSMVHVWTERHSQDMEQQAVNACGGAVGEGKFATTVDVSVPHNSDSVIVGFGSTIMEDDPYDMSWGVSGIEIYIR